uniref:Peptidase_S9 domain-containing protein n=1 Tax=Schistocephalus solidus TaxID=70667 RepID=A0A183TCY1_SCHSO
LVTFARRPLSSRAFLPFYSHLFWQLTRPFSLGGYMSLMAAARYGDTYRAAIAGSPVVDWAHYDTAYTERYLGVLSYLQGFPDDAPYLMISHGGQDENVHFSHTSSLLQRLDSLGKPYEFFVSFGVVLSNL